MFLQIIYIGAITNLAITLLLYRRQFHTIKQSKVPKYLQEKISNEEYAKTKKYNSEKIIFSIIQILFNSILTFAKIYYNILPILYNKLDEGLQLKSELLTQIIFLTLNSLFDTIFHLPFSVYSTFVIEEKWGFNKTTAYVFITDLIKGFLLMSLIMPIIFTIIYQIIQYFVTFYLYVSLFLFVFQIAMAIIYPILIMPMFNKFEEMQDGSLKEKVVELTKKVKFAYSNIFVMDGSKRSGHSNAFFIGLFGERRIVFFDTLLEQTEENETVAILAHELGHWYYMHTWRGILFSSLYQAVSFYFFEIAVKNKNFSISLFGTEKVPLLLKLIYFSMVSSMIAPLMVLLANMFSRYNERQADLFAIQNGYAEDLAKGLIALYAENRAPLETDWMYSTYYHSHPTLNERISFINEYKQVYEKKEE
ncbi:Metalloprotease [Pseudoloma neurophilia]|uniref:CAAX prenyl protease n=1 Tax=Pseudoloma neurophilia TaxID=146866 RepID=A0A0R0M3H8_9MICR|nr:Metalloprotease [Pseudoloma neurophilia]